MRCQRAWWYVEFLGEILLDCLLQPYERFRSAAFAVVYRLRADRRIALIRAKLKSLGLAGGASGNIAVASAVLEIDGSRVQVRFLASYVYLLINAQKPKQLVDLKADAAHVRVSAFPIFSTEEEFKSVEVISPPGPDDIPLLPLRVPQQYKLLAYDKFALPALGTFPAPTETKTLREAAQFESAVLGMLGGVLAADLLCSRSVLLSTVMERTIV